LEQAKHRLDLAPKVSQLVDGQKGQASLAPNSLRQEDLKKARQAPISLKQANFPKANPAPRSHRQVDSRKASPVPSSLKQADLRKASSARNLDSLVLESQMP
jgi:hypothetical protein